jgi:hypothetical protein
MTYKSYKAELGSRLRDVMEEAGLHIRNMGLAGVLGLEVLSNGPLAAVQSGAKRQAASKAPLEIMGQLIVNKFAEFVPAQKHYVITEAGCKWLAAVKQHGFLELAHQYRMELENFKREVGDA